MDNSKLARMQNAERPVVAGAELPSFNSRDVYPYEPLASSASIDVWTGIANEKTLTETRDRAIYDENTLTYQPIADSNTGVLFPDAVLAKTAVESTLRVRPTTFKGPQQLDISHENADQHFERMIHPRGWRENLDGEWYSGGKEGPFQGYPNPDLFYFYSSAIPTQNLQNIGHAQMVEAMRTQTTGDFNHNEYLDTIGSLLKSDAVPHGPAVANVKEIIQTDGGGVDGDPRLAERMNEEYEASFNLAKRIRVADASNDPRFVASAPGIEYQKEQQDFAAAQETEFNKILEFAGIPTGYTFDTTVRTG